MNDIKLEIYKNIEINADRLSQVKFVRNKLQMLLKQKKLFIMDWPRSQIKYLSQGAVNKLDELNLKKNNRRNIFAYPISVASDNNGNSIDTIDFETFRDYFIIKRIESLTDEKIELVILGENIIVDNHIDTIKLIREMIHKDISCRVLVNNNNFTIIPPHLLSIIFFKLKYLKNFPFSTAEKIERTDYQIILKDERIFNEFSKISRNNFSQFLFDKKLFKVLRDNIISRDN